MEDVEGEFSTVAAWQGTCRHARPVRNLQDATLGRLMGVELALMGQ